MYSPRDWYEANRECDNIQNGRAHPPQSLSPHAEPDEAPPVRPGPILTCLADVEPCSVPWLWPDRIALGRTTLLAGCPGEGKSFLTMDIAARVSRGNDWPDGGKCPKGSVILLSAEDDPADTIRPRLDALDADATRVHLLPAVRQSDEHVRLITLRDVNYIREALEQLLDCRLIVVDPIGSFLGGGTDANSDSEVRSVLAPIDAMAREHGVAVLIVAHHRKSSGSRADDMVMGSRAFTGVARSVWHITRDQHDRERRLLLPGKSNLTREGHGLAFSFAGNPTRIEWEDDPVEMSADDALADEGRDRKPGPEPRALGEAMEWLRSALADGPRPSRELTDQWSEQGGSIAMLNRAKGQLGVKSYRGGAKAAWLCQLPPKVIKLPEASELEHLEHLAENGAVLADPGPSDPKSIKLSEPDHLAHLTPDDEWGEL